MDFNALFKPEAQSTVPSQSEPSVRELRLPNGNQHAWVIDNILEPDVGVQIHEWFKYLDYRFLDSDRDDTTFLKHLICTFEPDEYEGGTPAALLVNAAVSVMESLGIQYGALERVYANFNLFGDHQFAHTDGDFWTVLFFVNSVWGEDWGGELLLYEDGPHSLAYAIQPRPGRMAVFDGTLHHRGGAPTKFCLEARISLAIKFAKA